MKIIKLAIGIILVTMFACSADANTSKISQQDFLSLQKSDAPAAIVLDVRTAEEFAAGHVAGAINISHNDISNNLNKLAEFKNKTVVVYCRSGRRAGKAEAILAENGFNKLLHLNGDMNGWLDADLPVEK